MNKYKINIVYNKDNINDIFIKSLKKEIENNLKMIYKKSKNELPSLCTYLNQNEDGK